MFLQTVCYQVKEKQDVEKALKGILVVSTIPMTPALVCLPKARLPHTFTGAVATKMGSGGMR